MILFYLCLRKKLNLINKQDAIELLDSIEEQLKNRFEEIRKLKYD
jgi:hypothetical protein